MPYYYNGRARAKNLVLTKVVGNTTEQINGGSTGIASNITAAFTALDGTVYSALNDTQFARLSSEAYYRRLADFVALVKSQVVAQYPEFEGMDLFNGAVIMTDKTGLVPGT